MGECVLLFSSVLHPSFFFCMMHSKLTAIIFLIPLFSKSPLFCCPLTILSPFIISSYSFLSFILSLICHGPPSTLIGPHLPIPQQPLTTVCVTGALNLNQCAQVKHILHTCFTQTHTQYSDIVTAVYASAGELCLYFIGEAGSVQIDDDCDSLSTMLCFFWLCCHCL